MVFCKNCGTQLPSSDVIYCPACGDQQNNTNRTTVAIQAKNTGTAIVIALVGGFFGFCGVGHMYLGKISYGVGLLVIGWGMLFLTWLGVFLGMDGNIFAVLGLFGIVYLVYWIWQTYDVNKKAKYYNDYLMRNGREPW